MAENDEQTDISVRGMDARLWRDLKKVAIDRRLTLKDALSEAIGRYVAEARKEQ
jgi:hypothetical protein